MAIEVFDNAGSPGTSTFLTSDLGASDVVLPVDGAASPALQQGQFRCVLINISTGEQEYVLVTDQQWTSNWKVDRGVENTAALDFPKGSIVRHVLTADGLQNMVTQAAQISSGWALLIENVNIISNSGAGTIVLPDVTSFTCHLVTLTGNPTFEFPSLPPSGKAKSFLLACIQDGVGGRVVTWPNNVKWPGGAAPPPSAGAGKTDLYAFVCLDAATWLGMEVGTGF